MSSWLRTAGRWLIGTRPTGCSTSGAGPPAAVLATRFGESGAAAEEG